MKIALKDHMTRNLVTIQKEASAAEALRLMNNFWIRHLPVLNEDEDYIVGMISERDLLRAPSEATPVSTLMSTPIKTFDIETPMSAVVESMIEEKVSAYLISKNEEIVGIVTSDDLLILLDQILKKDESPKNWILSDVLINPVLQKTAYMVGQAGI